MLKNLITRLLERRHYWRRVSFDELSELYTSSLLRSLANSLIGIFVPIYLYGLGYDIRTIFWYYVLWFGLRPLYEIGNAFIIGRIGPKHSLALASAGQIVFLALLLSLGELNWPLWLVAQVGSWSMGMYLLAFHTDFSKIKHTEHGGKEIGYLVTLDKVGGVIGPLVGGLMATIFDPRYTIAAAMVMQCVALVPLFMTAEAVATRQKITFRGLPWRRHGYDYVSAAFISLENHVSIIIWPLFIAVFVLGPDPFAKLGLIVAVSTAISILSARTIGKLIDESRGGLLLRSGAVLNALLHCVRPFVRSFGGALVTNIANEPITAAYRMPYIKGMYDAADSLPGYRIAYLSSLGFLESTGKLVLCITAWALSYHFQARSLFQGLFIVGAVCSLGIMLERFPALRRSI